MKNKKKIAVQIYGHLRTYEKCFESLKKNILDLYDADVFIHTWDTMEHTTKSWYADSVRDIPKPVDQDIVSDIVGKYKPKKLLIEKQDFLDEKNYFGTHDNIKISLLGLKYMFYSQYKANSIREDYQKENKIQYEFVIVIRPDIFPYVELDINSFSNEFDYSEDISIHLVHNAEIHLRSNKYFLYPLAADIFYFSKPNVVSRICNIYNEFDRFFIKCNNIYPKNVENPEIAFFEYIYRLGIIPRQYQFYYAIKRKSSNLDIKLLPPKRSLDFSEPSPHSFKKTFAKSILDLYVKLCPNYILFKINKAVKYIYIASQYTEYHKEKLNEKK